MGVLDSVVGAATSANPWGAAAGLLGGAINLFTGNSQKKQGKKLLAQIGESPTEAVPTEVLENQRIARTNAATQPTNENISSIAPRNNPNKRQRPITSVTAMSNIVIASNI